ncbi:Leucine-rich repeat (LRR) protein, partial [Halanaerobacter jeridensis]|nr:Leucine-rich repeat (LRR) protein [Halanaerobacter jeridensis]
TGNQIEDITFLNELNGIKKLDIRWNKIEDINVLLELDNLKELTISKADKYAKSEQGKKVISKLKNKGVKIKY